MTIENTHDRDPMLHLHGVMSEGSDGYIQGMEAQGQRQLVNSTALPTQGDWEGAQALGVIRGEHVPGDSLFTNATLPEGWEKRATDHSMGSEVIDERGVPRISIFYKAAFYDRRADFHIVNVGFTVGTHMAYGEDTPELPGYWDALTDDEKRDCLQDLHNMQDRNRETLAIVGSRDEYWQERIDKVDAAIAVVKAAGVTL
jgi:hypothetical protein